MNSILDELYYGELNPEELIVPQDPEYRPLNRKIAELLDDCKKRFSEDDFKSIEYIMDLMGESNSMNSNASFNHGFRIGALMMIEVFRERGGCTG